MGDSSLDQFWIINKNTDSVYGPLKLREYENKKTSLGIDLGLEI